MARSASDLQGRFEFERSREGGRFTSICGFLLQRIALPSNADRGKGQVELGRRELAVRSTGGFSLIELIVVIAIIAILAGLLLPVLSRAREAGNRAVYASNLKQWGAIFAMYSHENQGFYPPTGVQWGGCSAYYPVYKDCKATDIWAIPSGPHVYPEYCTDAALYLCPSATLGGRDEDSLLRPGSWLTADGQPDPHEFNDRGPYWYFGYAFANQFEYATMQAAVNYVTFQDYPSPLRPTVDEAFRRLRNDLDWGDCDVKAFLTTEMVRFGVYAPVITEVMNELVPQGNGGGPVIYKLRNGVERFFVTDINNPGASATSESGVVVMFDNMEARNGQTHPNLMNHPPGGANVLYMDGHVAFKVYPSDDPRDVPSTRFCMNLGCTW